MCFWNGNVSIKKQSKPGGSLIKLTGINLTSYALMEWRNIVLVDIDLCSERLNSIIINAAE